MIFKIVKISRYSIFVTESENRCGNLWNSQSSTVKWLD